MSTSGAYLTAKYGSSPLEAEDNNLWKVAENAKELDRTVGADEGFGNVDPGILRATVTIHGWLDLATVTGGAYENLRAGSILTNVLLYYDRSDGSPGWNFPLAAVLDSELGGEVDGQFEWTCTIKNKGAYAYNPPA